MTMDLAELEEGSCYQSWELAHQVGTKISISRQCWVIPAHRHLGIICILVCSYSDSGLHTALYITFVGIHLHEF